MCVCVCVCVCVYTHTPTLTLNPEVSQLEAMTRAYDSAQAGLARVVGGWGGWKDLISIHIYTYGYINTQTHTHIYIYISRSLYNVYVCMYKIHTSKRRCPSWRR